LAIGVSSGQSKGHFVSIFQTDDFEQEGGRKYLSLKYDPGGSNWPRNGLIVPKMRPRRTLKPPKYRRQARHVGFRNWVDWLTLWFAIACGAWMVVMLFLYEWHSIHGHFKQ
jgi:hypothetical protein